ncbi:MAG TPA: OmpH family outer membrane protein [Pyrinomonadaceae bacterium]|jgi:Skp family chaperone for outer membrane proteins|nr:OmpH family outer membrane protein [Pyrinomonadaceae bacterium]
MKVIRHTFAAAALAAFAALSASAQTTPAQRPAPSTAAPAQSGGAIAEGRFAIVDTDAFTDQKQGIHRLVVAFQTVEREFKPRRDELQQMQTRYEALAKQISDTQKVADQKALASLADQADTLKSDIEQKQAAGQKALDKRVKELTEPIYQDIGNALQTFARGRGISVVFDISKMQGVVMLVNPAGVDITDAFIADYNQRNPASTASTATPGNP